MCKADGRKVSHGAREAIRIEAIQKWLDGAKVRSLPEEYGTDKVTSETGYFDRGFIHTAGGREVISSAC